MKPFATSIFYNNDNSAIYHFLDSCDYYNKWNNLKIKETSTFFWPFRGKISDVLQVLIEIQNWQLPDTIGMIAEC
jgi:hypothetical protein